MTERILFQTAERYVLCDGQTHILVLHDAKEWPQGVCDCLDVDHPWWKD